MIQLKTSYMPETLGYDSSRLEVLNRFLQEQIDKKVLIGADYAMARDGKLFAAGALGKQSFRAEDDRPLKPDTIFNIASITKMFTAVAVFKLVEDGLCRLDDTMKTWLPEMDAEDFAKVTIAHVLSHTGGLYVEDGAYDDVKIDCWELVDKEFDSDGSDWISVVLKAGRTSEFGTRWEYSTFGFALLGVLIERISGIKASQYIEENIIVPCGMTDSGFWNTVKKFPDIAGRLFIHSEKIENDLKNLDKDRGPWEAIPETGWGVYSTVTDLMKFGTMLINGGRLEGNRILGRKAVEKMTAMYTTPKVQNFCWGRNGIPKPFGLGVDLELCDFYLSSPGTYYHEGSGRCLLMIDPTGKFVLAYFIPLVDTDFWDPESGYNPQNIICSGLI